MPTRYLGGLARPVPTRTRVLRVALGVFLAVWWGLAGFSGYRAIYQVRSIELRHAGNPLEPGARIHASIVTSGRTVARLRLMLVQDGAEALLASASIPGNRDGALDPRFRRETLEVEVTEEVLSRFRPGPARVRAVGLGTSQFLRVPPPKVRELPVTIAARGQPGRTPAPPAPSPPGSNR